MSIINDHCQVLFVGTGPVALFTAIQAKLQNPKLEIALMDRFEEYVRNQNLSIASSSFRTMCDLRKIKKQHPQYTQQIDDFAQCILNIKNNKKIKINLLENQLRQIAEKLDISFHRGFTFQSEVQATLSEKDIVGVEGLKKAFPQVKLIIGADGAHSKIRDVVFNNNLKVDIGLQYTIAVRYWVKDKSKHLSSLTSYPTQKIVGFTQEHVGKYDKDRKATPINIQFFVDKETFERFHDYKAGNTLAFEQVESLNPLIAEKIKTWLSVRKEKLNDELESDIDVYTIKLPIYQSRDAVQQINQTPFCLVGDALFGVPFFRSINNGFLCGSKLSKKIVQMFDPPPLTLKKRLKNFAKTFFMSKNEAQAWKASPLKRYAVYADRLGNKEIFRAHVKNLILKCYKLYLKISDLVPWQVNKWNKKDRNRLIEFDYKFITNHN